MTRRGLRAGLACAVLAVTLPSVAFAGDAAREGLQRLRSWEQRTRLQDLSIDARRQQQDRRIRPIGDPAAGSRVRERWRREDRQTDFQRAREREAIERRFDAERRLERAAQTSRAPAADPAAEGRLDRALREADQRARLHRLSRDAARSGPGAYPRRR